VVLYTAYRAPRTLRALRGIATAASQQRAAAAGAANRRRSGLAPHVVVWSEVASLAVDLPFILLGSMVTLSVYRGYCLWRDLFAAVRAGASDRAARWLCVEHTLKLGLDVPCIAFGIVIALTGYRLPGCLRRVRMGLAQGNFSSISIRVLTLLLNVHY
jgi:hypothetical protein